MYVNPPTNAVWSGAAIETHGIRPADFAEGGSSGLKTTD